MIKPIAIHLPQFHPIPENDEWWGKGFTEWTNVARARPRFKEHYQPHLPADLGFYDLRLEEARVAQAEMAHTHGIYGFCHYHYWFNGRRVLHRPLDDMLQTQTPDFPFMLCWANENWTRRWDGEDQQVLLKQEYSEADNEAHFRFLCTSFFADRRYIRVNNKPVFVIYRASVIPDVAGLIRTGNRIAQEHGFAGLHFICMDNFVDAPAESLGFSGAVHFHPDYRYFHPNRGGRIEKLLHKTRLKRSFKYSNHFEHYDDYVQKVLAEDKTISKNIYPGLTPGWDNSARRKTGATIFHNSTPQTFRRWLHALLPALKERTGEDNFLFINAWNEWAEGNHLEPCQKWGNAYLQAVKEELNNLQ